MHLFSEFGDGLRSYVSPRDKHHPMEPSIRLLTTLLATIISVALWVGLYALIRWLS